MDTYIAPAVSLLNNNQNDFDVKQVTTWCLFIEAFK